MFQQDAGRPFNEGDLALLKDNKGRRYLLTLSATEEFQTHAGSLAHSTLIGSFEGAQVKSSRGQRFRVYRPTLSEFILSMPRGAQVIYPKDIGPILLLADIGPAMKVFESGVGSGALSMAMLRCGANITGYELREDFASRAKKNVTAFLGEEALQRYEVKIANSYEGIEESGFDRVVLDLPEPWRVVPHAAKISLPGAIFVSYSPSITQIIKTHESLLEAGFSEISTMETMNRNWHIEGHSVRPEHRMVAHTGFLISARYAHADSIG